MIYVHQNQTGQAVQKMWRGDGEGNSQELVGAIYCPKTSNETFEEFRQRRYAELKKDGSLPTHEGQ